AIFTISIGVIVGLVAGYLGGRVESILMRFTDVILVIPVLPLVIILAAVLGAGVGNIILVISIVGWPGVARVIRAEVLSLKERPFIDSARVTGARNVRIMFRHIAPNVAPLAFLYMTFAVSGPLLPEPAPRFIGLGDVGPGRGERLRQDDDRVRGHPAPPEQRGDCRRLDPVQQHARRAVLPRHGAERGPEAADVVRGYPGDARGGGGGTPGAPGRDRGEAGETRGDPAGPRGQGSAPDGPATGAHPG